MNEIAMERQSQPITADPNEILTVQQAAEMLKVSYSHMLRLIRGAVSGIPPVHHIRAGRSMRVRRGALIQWIRDVEHHSGAQSPDHAGLERVEMAYRKRGSAQC